MTYRALDLFCGAGGASMGLHRAGFEVTGVDLAPQDNYPFAFCRMDALEFLSHGSATRFDFIWASPPCQAYSLASGYHRSWQAHPDLVGPVRDALVASGVPWVIENVPNAPLRRDAVLCGEMFGLRVHRHRWFEFGGWFALMPPHKPHRLCGAKHNCDVRPGVARLVAGHYSNHADASDAMGITWMAPHELSQAIPPAYSEHIARQWLATKRAAA